MSSIKAHDKAKTFTTPSPISRIARRTLGQSHGPITRLMSPRNRGEFNQDSVIDQLPRRACESRRKLEVPVTGNTVLWTAIGRGSVLVPDELQHGELVAFRPSSDAIEFEAESDAEFVLGSAVPHDYDLVLGFHSVYTAKTRWVKPRRGFRRSR